MAVFDSMRLCVKLHVLFAASFCVVVVGKPGGAPADALTECVSTALVALTGCASASGLPGYNENPGGTGSGEATVAVGVAGSDRAIQEGAPLKRHEGCGTAPCSATITEH